MEEILVLENLPEKRKKFCYVGAPKIFALELACRHIDDAFESYGIYLVGSALERPDWRDVDLRMIMADEEFFKLFPDAKGNGSWEFDARWLLLTTSISEYLSKLTELPIDFQFQPATHANDQHKGSRHAVGMRLAKEKK